MNTCVYSLVFKCFVINGTTCDKSKIRCMISSYRSTLEDLTKMSDDSTELDCKLFDHITKVLSPTTSV